MKTRNPNQPLLANAFTNETWYQKSLPAVLKLRRLFRPLAFRIIHPLLLYLNRKPSLTKIGRLTLHTDPHVFHPSYHFTSKILAEYVATLELSNRQVLDIGTGSGIIGITAAMHGAEVTAIDINPQAAMLAARNALENKVEAKMRVLCSDLFNALSPAPIFDWIIFNPPFFPRAATHPLEAAFNAGKNYEVIARFMSHAADFLSTEGRLLFILSSDMNLQEINRMVEQANFKIVRCDMNPHIFEIFYLIQLKPIA